MTLNAILNIQFQPVWETLLFCMIMTSVPSHWLTAELFVVSLYKCDTTRMVGRPVNSTVICASLLILPRKIPPWSVQSTSFVNHPPKYSYTAYISLIPHIHLHSLHLINPLHIPTQDRSRWRETLKASCVRWRNEDWWWWYLHSLWQLP